MKLFSTCMDTGCSQEQAAISGIPYRRTVVRGTAVLPLPVIVVVDVEVWPCIGDGYRGLRNNAVVAPPTRLWQASHDCESGVMMNLAVRVYLKLM